MALGTELENYPPIESYRDELQSLPTESWSICRWNSTTGKSLPVAIGARLALPVVEIKDAPASIIGA